MTENDQKRMLNFCGEDRISNLPQGLIDSVLERVPIHDAARTSVLSTKWRQIWNTLPVLVLDDRFYKGIAKNGALASCNGFVGIVNRILFHHQGPILKFVLRLPEANTNLGFQDLVNQWNSFLSNVSYQELNLWMSFLSRSGVRELVIVNCYSNESYKELPSYVFSCPHLTTLCVYRFVIKPLPKSGLLSSLKNLHLKNVVFEANPSGTVFSTPHLTSMGLQTCTGVYNFNIRATNLLSLSVDDCDDVMVSLLMNNPDLTTIFITPSNRVISSSPSAEKTDLRRLLGNLAHLQHLIMDRYALEILSVETIPDRPQVAISNLYYLKLIGFLFCDVHDLRYILLLLLSLPGLTTLGLWQTDTTPVLVDECETMKILQAPDCMNQKFILRSVDIRAIKGYKTELFFIQLLLGRSPYLRYLHFQPSNAVDSDTRIRILRDVTRFHRASTRAEVIYLDPVP